MTHAGRSDWGRGSQPVRYEPEYDDYEDPAPAPRPTATGEPVVIGQVVTVLIGAMVTAGWITLDDQTIQLLVTGAGLLVSAVVTVMTRARVSPLKGGLRETVAEVVDEFLQQAVAEQVRVELERRRRIRQQQ
jgi:hypothetical protein